MIESRKLGALIGAAMLSTSFQVAAQDLPADLPPNAKAGECYARTFVPAQYDTNTEEVLRREASARIETIPARYETVTEQVLVQEASSRLVPVPAQYETVRETIEVAPAYRHWHVRSAGGKATDASDAFVKAAGALGLPESAEPGQCFAEYVVPAQFETLTEQVLKSDATERVEIIPAKYEWVEEQVLVSEAGSKIVEVPAVYKTVTEKVLVKPAHKMWKKGRGPIEKVNDNTGEIMCLVEVPDQFETVTKRIIETPATTRKVEIPAKYETVRVRKLASAAKEQRVAIPAEYATVTKRNRTSDAVHQWVAKGASSGGNATGRQLCVAETPAKSKTVARRVLKTPASTRKVEIPAEYKTVKVRKIAEPAQERRIEIPAEYATVTKRNLVKDGHMTWVSILCETNTTPGVVSNIQRALKQEGYNPGPIDGVFGRQTQVAVRNFQQAKGLPTGGLTVATLDALKVSAR